MAALHDALHTLAPVDFSVLPVDDLKPYLKEAFAKSQLIIDSIPPPSDDASPTVGRSRSSTVSSTASNASEMLLSPARPAPPIAEHSALQKEWGKPLKLSAKDNPLGMSVFKLSGKDGRGAWFARRSVHEGLGFAQWKKSLEQEFPETLQFQGGPGEGNIRGIGGERVVEQRGVQGVGKLEVYHLSAQFPGPTTPRDFVTLLITSSSAFDDLPKSSEGHTSSAAGSEGDVKNNAQSPRHYMIISKPCSHPDCPPRDGYIRGNYESVEFIREIPIHKASVGNATKSGRKRASSSALGKEAILRNATASHPGQLDPNSITHGIPTFEMGKEGGDKSQEGRRRSKTVGVPEAIKERDGADTPAKPSLSVEDGPIQDDDAESNPVEWIMITRSDPGGSVPRFMVERGTPAAIVTDARKFLDWACQKQLPLSDNEEEKLLEEPSEPEIAPDQAKANRPTLQVNGTAAGPVGSASIAEESESASAENVPHEGNTFLSSVADAMTAGFNAVAPSSITSHFPGSMEATPTTKEHNLPRTTSNSSISTADSFATASTGRSGSTGDGISANAEASSSHTTPSPAPKDPSGSTSTAQTPQEKALARLTERKRALDAKLAAARPKRLATSSASTSTTTPDDPAKQTEPTPKETTALAKAEEKHARDVAREEEKYAKEISKIDARQRKDERKADERRKKQADKDERSKWARERERLTKEVESGRKQREVLLVQVGELQRENTRLVAKLGSVDGEALKELRDEVRKVKGGNVGLAALPEGLRKEVEERMQQEEEEPVEAKVEGEREETTSVPVSRSLTVT
ncbi:MAG: hypothetical protein M1833_000635 [Piccolia ochrophora]|nr:MAG: hypothetical protein M1833_000635 [Piccolia ochrophora]